MSDEPLVIPIGRQRRILVDVFDDHRRGRLVRIREQQGNQNRTGWYPLGAALLLDPATVRELVPALVQVAAGLDGTPEDPYPTQADREASRWP